MEPNGILNLTFKKKENGETYLSNQFFKLPLQIFPPDAREDGSVFLFLLNPSSGMLEGDLFDLRFQILEGAEVTITTPSSNKIYKSNGPDTHQHVYASIAKGSVLEYIPEQNVPFKNSRFFQKSIYEIEKGGTLLTWDCMMPGRLERGEDFDFQIYQSETSIIYDGKMLIREGMKIIPEELNPHNPAQMGEYAMVASLYVACECIPDGLCEKIRDYFSNEREIYAGISKVDEHLAVIKILWKETLHMRDDLWEVWNIARKEVLGKKAYRIRKY